MHKYQYLLFPVLILLAGLALRLAYLEEIRHTPEFSHPIYDPEYNAYWARGIATGDWTVPAGVHDPEIRTTPHGRPPGYPWFLGAVYGVFGVNDYAPRLIQMLLGLINALLLYALGKRLFNNYVGFVAGLGMALYWVFPYFEGLLTYPSLAVFLLLCLLHCLHQWQHNCRTVWIALAGALLGAFALLRPNGLLLLPLLLAWVCWGRHREGFSLSRLAQNLLVLIVACVAVLVPAFIRNYLVARDFVFLSSYGGINLYVGNHPKASLVEPRIPELIDWAGIENWSCFDYPAIVRGVAAQQGRESLKYSEANHFFYEKAFEFIRNDPGHFMANLARKTALFWGPSEITNDTVMEYDKRYSRILGNLPGFPWILACFLVGACCWLVDMARGRFRARDGETRLLLLVLSMIPVYCLSVIIYFVAGRYRVPVIPFMILFGAYGIVRFCELVAGKKVWALCLLITVFALSCFVAHYNFSGYTPSEGTWHLRRAMAHTRAGQEQQAEQEYLNALAHGAESSLIYANLGRLHLQRGDREGAMDLYRRGLQVNPNNSVIRNNLGYELYRAGNLEEAISQYEQAIKANPRFALVRVNMGNALAESGKHAEALCQYLEAMRIEPRDFSAAYNAARMYFSLNDLDNAIACYNKAVDLDPESADALNNLGYCHEVKGEADTAVQYYEKAVHANPAYTLAYNNLGNVLFAMNRQQEAIHAYKGALEQNEADVYALYNLGRVYEQGNDLQQADSYCMKAVDTAPEYLPALLMGGRIKLALGAETDAASLLGRALVLDPGNQEAAALLSRIEKERPSEGEKAS